MCLLLLLLCTAHHGDKEGQSYTITSTYLNHRFTETRYISTSQKQSRKICSDHVWIAACYFCKDTTHDTPVELTRIIEGHLLVYRQTKAQLSNNRRSASLNDKYISYAPDQARVAECQVSARCRCCAHAKLDIGDNIVLLESMPSYFDHPRRITSVS